MIRNTKLKQDVLRGIWKLYAMAFTNISDESWLRLSEQNFRRISGAPAGFRLPRSAAAG